jgi:hypothetical protein
MFIGSPINYQEISIATARQQGEDAQGEDMNESPHQPGEESARVQSAPFKYRVILPDDGHVALIEIAERKYDLLALQLFRDQPPDIPPS